MSQPIHDGSAVLQIQALVRSSRRALRLGWMTTGAALTVGICLALTLAAALSDLIVPLPVPLRAAAFVAILVPTTMALLAGVVGPAARRLSVHQVARRIERTIPQIQSRLVTTMDLASDSQHRHSPTFFQRLVSETAERLGGFRSSSLIDGRHLKRATLLCLIAIGCFSMALIVFRDRLPTALARIFLPFADIPPVSGVLYMADPGDAKVLKGDELTIAAILHQGDTSELEFEFRPLAKPGATQKSSPSRRWVRYPMARGSSDRFEFDLNHLEDSFEYRLVGGGTWTRRHRIEVIDRPAVTDWQVTVRYPEYMKLPEPRVGPPQSGDASGPAGSDVEVAATVSGDAVSGEIHVLTPVVTMQPVTERRERVWFESSLPPGARAEGSWQWDHSLKFRPAHTQPPSNGHQSHGFHGAEGFLVQPGQHLYTYVFIVPEHVPEEIMLQWHDGSNWEHRAFWGADKIAAGTPNSPSRFRAGDLPETGQWVLLDVPARAVGLEGKKIHGMSFMTFGGQSKWNRAGTIDPGQLPERSFIVEWKYPMNRTEESADGTSTHTADGIPTSRWLGRLPLTRDTLYRIEFKNELGYTNKEMKEGKLTAIPDNPPQIVLERPGADLVLTSPQVVPLSIRAYDDFGLSDVSLAVQKGDSGGFVGAPIEVFDEPTRHASLIGSLDLAPHQLKVGEHVRYRVQARDRKGQIAQTQEFIVRIAQDQNAADKQLATLEKQQETFREKLAQLIEQQSKVTETVAKLAGREEEQRDAPASQSADAAADPAANAKPDAPKSETAAKPEAKPENTKSDAKSDAQAAPASDPPPTPAEIRAELAKLAAPQQANIQLGSQVQAELNQTATQAANSRLVPEPVANQMRAAEHMFQEMALKPMRDVLQSLQSAADSKQPPPNIQELADETAQIQKQLEDTQARLDALARAQQGMRDDPAAAMAQLNRDMMQQNAQLTSRELAELRDFLDRLMGQMNMLEGRENELMRQTRDAKPVMLPDIEQEQTKIEKEAARLLAQAEPFEQADMMNDPERAKGMEDPTPGSMDETASGEGMDEAAPADSADAKSTSASETPADEMKAKAKKAKTQPAPTSKPASDDGPASDDAPPAGVREKLDPRFAKKSPKAKKKAATANAESPSEPQADAASSTPGSEPSNQRSRLAQRQQQTAQELRNAQQRLSPRREELASLIEQLDDAMLESSQSGEELSELMQSAPVQQALELAQAMREQGESPNGAESRSDRSSQVVQALLQSLGPASQIDPRRILIGDFEGNQIDLAGQAVLLRMQPRLREELLKGMNEEGPEGYRKFIQDYFDRLTKVKPQ